MQITIYSTSTCPYCQKLKDYLEEKKAAYTEKLIDIDETAKTEMIGISGGFLGVPFSLITFDDGRRETVVGFDKGRFDSLFNPQ